MLSRVRPPGRAAPDSPAVPALRWVPGTGPGGWSATHRSPRSASFDSIVNVCILHKLPPFQAPGLLGLESYEVEAGSRAEAWNVGQDGSSPSSPPLRISRPPSGQTHTGSPSFHCQPSLFWYLWGTPSLPHSQRRSCALTSLANQSPPSA